MKDRKATGACPVCKGDIIVHYFWQRIPGSGPTLIGADIERQHRTASTTYCYDCGVQFYHLPKGVKLDEEERETAKEIIPKALQEKIKQDLDKARLSKLSQEE